jgi:hypothetical protein
VTDYRRVPIDVSGPLGELCSLLGVHPNFVSRLDIEPSLITVVLYRGTEGRCKGTKYVERHPGALAEPAMETLRFEVRT